MDITINIVGEKEIVKLIEGMGDRAKDLSEPLADFGERLVRRIGKRISKLFDEKTGKLGASLTYQETKDELTVSAGGKAAGGGEAVKYAKVLHKGSSYLPGGVIKPKKAKALTIPFPGGPADRRVPLRASDFEDDDTFIAKGIIFRKIEGSLSNEDAIEPLFILKKSVEIPATPYMFIEDSDREYLKKSILSYIRGRR